MTTLTAWYIVFICISILLGLLIINWYITFITLYKRNTQQICVRYPKAVILSGICFSIQACISTPLAIILNGIVYDADPSKRYVFLDVIYAKAVQFGVQAMPYFLIYRAYMLYFDIRWNLALQDSQWQIHIDPSLKQNWFLSNRKSFGSRKKCAVFLFSIWFFYFIANTIFLIANGFSIQKNKDVRMLLTTPQTYVVPFIFFIIILCKLPEFNDIYLVRKEIKYSILIWFLWLIINAISGLIDRITGGSGTSAAYGTITYGLTHLRISFLSVTICYLLFHWTAKKFHLPTNVFSLWSYNDNAILLDQYSVPNKRQTSISIGSEKITYLNILKDTVGFRYFTNHLSKSWAIENVLFIIEIIQFRNKLQQIFGSINTDDTNLLSLFEITSQVPKSSLVDEIDEKKK
eukprot:554564_1